MLLLQHQLTADELGDVKSETVGESKTKKNPHNFFQRSIVQWNTTSGFSLDTTVMQTWHDLQGMV